LAGAVVAGGAARDAYAAVAVAIATPVFVTIVRCDAEIRRYAHRRTAVLARRARRRARADAIVATGGVVADTRTTPYLVCTRRPALIALAVAMVARKTGATIVALATVDRNVGIEAVAVQARLTGITIARAAALRFCIVAAIVATISMLALLTGGALVALAAEDRREAGDTSVVEAT